MHSDSKILAAFGPDDARVINNTKYGKGQQMNKEEYESIAELADLPCYHEKNAQCDSLQKPMDRKYSGVIVETNTIDDAKALFSDPSYEIKGTILYTDGSKDFYRPVFWKLR